MAVSFLPEHSAVIRKEEGARLSASVEGRAFWFARRRRGRRRLPARWPYSNGALGAPAVDVGVADADARLQGALHLELGNNQVFEDLAFEQLNPDARDSIQARMEFLRSIGEDLPDPTTGIKDGVIDRPDNGDPYHQQNEYNPVYVEEYDLVGNRFYSENSLLTNLIAASRELGRNEDRIPVWQAMLEKMTEYMIDENGIIKEWLTPRLENRDSHRHSSQLYPLFDGMPYPASCAALEDSIVLTMSPDAFHRLVAREPAIARAVSRASSSSLKPCLNPMTAFSRCESIV